MRKQQKGDPTFALISDYKAKLTARDKAHSALKRLEEKMDAKADHQARAEKRLLSGAWPPLYLGHAYPIYAPGKGVKEHVFFRLREAGSAFGPKMQRKLMALQPFARKEIEQMFAAFQAEHRRKRDAAGLTALHKQLMAAMSACSKAQRRMVSTAPRTPQGAAALADALTYVDPDDPDQQIAVRSLARAVAMAEHKR